MPLPGVRVGQSAKGQGDSTLPLLAGFGRGVEGGSRPCCLRATALCLA